MCSQGHDGPMDCLVLEKEALAEAQARARPAGLGVRKTKGMM